MANRYPETVKAALSETRSKFALAEALATEIPPRHRGPSEEANIPVLLAEAREAVIAAGGEPKAIETLREYRLAALWVCGGSPTNFSWVPGLSFTAHSEARRAGISYEDFTANPKTSRQTRHDSGIASKDGGANVLQYMSTEEKTEVARALISDPEVAPQVQQMIAEVETKAAIAAVAATRNESPEVVAETRPDEVRRTRDVARNKAERKGTTTKDEVGAVAPVVAAVTNVHENLTKPDVPVRQSFTKESARLYIHNRVADAETALARALMTRGANWDGDDKDHILLRLDRVRVLVMQLEDVITGNKTVDWDDELQKILDNNEGSSA